MRKFFSEIEPCFVGMEACASSHYWARELLAMGHDVRLIPPIYVKPYVKRGKNDAADAAAVCEAMSRPGMRFVPVKSEESQATLMLHKTRELLIKQQTMSVNALRGHLAEFGIVAAKGIGRVEELIEKAENDASLPEAAMAALRVFVQHLEAIDASIADLDRRIASAHAQNEVSRLLVGIPGVGKITAPAIVASVADPNVFKSGRDFSAWLGSTPRQNSSGGKKTWLHHQKGQRLYQEALGAGRDVVAERHWQTQGRDLSSRPAQDVVRDLEIGQPSAIGSSRSSRAGPRGSSRSRSPTSLPGSYGRS